MALPFLPHNQIQPIFTALSQLAQNPNALNRHAGGGSNLSLYLLIEILEREAQLTAINIRLVSERKLKRIQWKTYRNQQEKLFQQWELYENGKKTIEELLRFCSHINGPARG